MAPATVLILSCLATLICVDSTDTIPSLEHAKTTIEKYAQDNEDFFNKSGFEKIREVSERSLAFMELANKFANTFINGELGKLVSQDVELVLNSSTKKPLKAAVDAVYALKKHSPVAPFESMPDKVNLTVLHFYLKPISLKFLDQWTDNDYDFKQTVPSNVGRWCRESFQYDGGADDAVKAWKYLMGKRCDTEDNIGTDYKKFRDSYAANATYKNFEGGDTNKCFHKFFIRYTNYDEAVYEAFVGIMAEILFLELNFYGFCLPIVDHDNYDERARWARESVAEIAAQLLAAKDDVLKDQSHYAVFYRKFFEPTVNANVSLLGPSNTQNLTDRIFDSAPRAAKAFMTYFDASAQQSSELNASVLRDKRGFVLKELIGIFKLASSAADSLYIPFGKENCGLLPRKIEDSVVPITSSPSTEGLRSMMLLFEEALESVHNETFDEAGGSHEVKRICQHFEAANILATLKGEVGDACSETPNVKKVTELQQQLRAYAESHAFNGTDNMCLHVFVAHYTNGSAEAIRKFMQSLDKYLFLAANLQAFCSSFYLTCDTECSRTAAGEAVFSLSNGMKDLFNKSGIELDDSIPWSCGSYQTSTTKVPEKESTTFYSVAMLTYNDNNKICTSRNKDSVYGTHEHVTYLAQPCLQDKLAPHMTVLTKNYEQEILDKTFSSASNDLCETAASALKGVLGMSVEETASAYVVARCGYKFVWYQLGYENFPAANSTSPYALTTHQSNVYSANCGQIILFP